MPQSPWGAKVRGDPMSTAESGLMKAKRALSRIDFGSFCPCISLSLGLGSNKSTCEGAPAMKIKMQALAFAG